MRQFARSGLLGLIVIMPGAVAQAQGPANHGQVTAGAPPAPNARPPRPSIFDQVLATVNGEPITRGELLQYLSQYAVPPGDDQNNYKVGLEGLINHKVVVQYLTKLKIPVTEKEIDGLFNELAENLKKEGRDINVALASDGITVAQVREEMRLRLLWTNYIKLVATDPVLEKYVADHKDIFNRTMVRASHIMVRVDEDAPPAEKQKARAKLMAIKAEIDAKKISFADAANKYSDDEVKKEKPMGGDLGFFTRRGQFEPNFSAAAFALPKGVISPQPVETPYGLHLIQVTDRKEGTPVDFKQNKLMILEEYSVDVQERIVKEMLKTAKIDIKPMPADLFPKVPMPLAAPTPPAPPETTKDATKPR